MTTEQGKRILITGASSGIGRATAIALARRGAELLLVGRSPERCDEALAAVKAAGGDDAVMLQGDLASLAGIRQLAKDVRAQIDRLDVLINNAGVTLMSRQETADGFEKTFAVNHLGYFLLTGLLLPLLGRADSARIVSVASEGHRFGKLNFDDLQNQQKYSGIRVYGQSKCANVLWNVELAKRLANSGITANCLHPGGVRTNLGGNNGPMSDMILRVVHLFLKSPEKGAATSVFLAASPEVEGVTGRYYVNCREKRASAHATDPEIARQLWELSEELVDFRYPD